MVEVETCPSGRSEDETKGSAPMRPNLEAPCLRFEELHALFGLAAFIINPSKPARWIG
jgi:hypothetical protein